MPDINYSNVTLLLDCDGSSGSTSFVDHSPAPLSVTAVAGANVSTAVSKFGSGSANIPGAGSYLSVPNAAATQPDATGDFTAELWFRYDSFTNGVTGSQGSDDTTLIWNKNASNNQGWDIRITAGGTFLSSSCQHSSGAGGLDIDLTATPLVAGTFYHAALTRQGTTLRLFLNGVLGASRTQTGTYTTNATGNLQIGRSGRYEDLIGHVDEVRITKGVARYTANFTPPTAAFEYPITGGTATASLTAPMATLVANGRGPSAAALVAPKPTLAAFGGGSAFVQPPAPSITALVRDATGERAAYLVAPTQRLTAHFGGYARPAAPMPTLAVTGTFTVVARASLVAPTPTLTATGRTSAMASAMLTAPRPAITGNFGGWARIGAGIPTLSANGTNGAVVFATLAAPMPALVARATRVNSGSAVLMAPMGRVGAASVAHLMAPGPQLLATGYEVRAITYEAYALNLKHDDDKATDELTRYTNYPFDRIIRYQNSYYGMNSTGLYLLEGTTDAGTDIPYTVKTHETDFDKSNLKTVVSATMGGRLGVAETVTLYAGEKTTNAYSHTTPRGATPQNYRQKFGRGIKARYYAIGFSGSKEFDLDTLEFDINELTRRI